MTIAYSGGTGSPAASAQGSTSISVAYPAFVAAGRIAFLYATVKLSSATFNTTISGWTFIGEQAGGTGASANDAGTTKIAAWYRILDGTESGSVTITNTGGVSSAGAMDIYEGTLGGWATPVFVGGADTTHGTDWSVTGGTWPSALAVNDWILLPQSHDTDTTQTISGASRVLTQTGITFAGNNFRSRSLSTTGTDCGLYSYDFRVTAGSNTNAPNYVHTSNTAHCGAQLFIRLREAAVDVTGTASVVLPALATDATGAVGVSGTADAALPALDASAAGTVRAEGTVDALLPALDASLAGTVTAAGNVSGTADVLLPALDASLAGSAQAAGTVDAALPALGATAAGSVRAAGTADIVLPALGVDATGTVAVGGAASVTLPSLDASLAGFVGSPSIEGDATVLLPALSITLDGLVTLDEPEDPDQVPLGGIFVLEGIRKDLGAPPVPVWRAMIRTAPGWLTVGRSLVSRADARAMCEAYLAGHVIGRN